MTEQPKASDAPKKSPEEIAREAEAARARAAEERQQMLEREEKEKKAKEAAKAKADEQYQGLQLRLQRVAQSVERLLAQGRDTDSIVRMVLNERQAVEQDKTRPPRRPAVDLNKITRAPDSPVFAFRNFRAELLIAVDGLNTKIDQVKGGKYAAVASDAVWQEFQLIEVADSVRAVLGKLPTVTKKEPDAVAPKAGRGRGR